MLCSKNVDKAFYRGVTIEQHEKGQILDFLIQIFSRWPLFQNPKTLKSFRPESPEIIRNLQSIGHTELDLSIKNFFQTKFLFDQKTRSKIFLG